MECYILYPHECILSALANFVLEKNCSIQHLQIPSRFSGSFVRGLRKQVYRNGNLSLDITETNDTMEGVSQSVARDALTTKHECEIGVTQ